MSEKVAEAQGCLEGALVARMILEFIREFRGIYPEELLVHYSAVGPLHTLLGTAIKNGIITIQPGWRDGQ